MSTTVRLPRWDMAIAYPGLESVEFQRDFEAITRQIKELESLFDQLRIEKQVESPDMDGAVGALETVIDRFGSLLESLHTLQVYVFCAIATDSRDDRAQACLSELQNHLVLLSQLETRFTAWIGSLDVEAVIAKSPVAADHSFLLRRARIRADHLMSPAEEHLAAELSLTGSSAWSQLHGNISSQLSVPIEIDGRLQHLPMSVVRNMAHEPERDTRRRAYQAELETWKSAAVPLAAALNGIKGEANAIDARRGWESGLDVAVFNNNIDRSALDAMMEAARASFPVFRRYLRAKALVLDVPALAWYDLFAPVGGSSREWHYDRATDFILEQFGTYSRRMRDFASRAFDENWIDAEPRDGKRDGAFCVLLRNDESRILANYSSTYDSMSTLAHELGHGYHNLNLSKRSILRRDTPMALAETASIFCQTIIKQAALQRADQREQISILEASLQDDCQVVVDITSRFLFEQAVFDKRRDRELSVDEFNEIMLDSQRQTYGDGLDLEQLHPYMWAVKGHYYGPGRPFYNFPYMFGLLFGLGLYARYQEDPESFTASYDELLSSTGLADAATLTGRFGMDIQSLEFWNGSLGIIAQDVERFESLVR